MPDRALTAALLQVVRTQLDDDALPVAVIAARMGVQRPTLSRQLRGVGVLTVDEWEALALALGEAGLDGLLARARRLM